MLIKTALIIALTATSVGGASVGVAKTAPAKFEISAGPFALIADGQDGVRLEAAKSARAHITLETRSGKRFNVAF